MRHYFVPSEHKEEDYFEFSAQFMGKNFIFKDPISKKCGFEGHTEIFHGRKSDKKI